MIQRDAHLYIYYVSHVLVLVSSRDVRNSVSDKCEDVKHSVFDIVVYWDKSLYNGNKRTSEWVFEA